MTNKPIAECRFFIFIVFSALLFLIPPGLCHAEEQVSLFQIKSSITPPITQSAPLKNFISFNDNGDMIIRCNRGTITLAYIPPEDESVKFRNMALASSNQEYPSINGISVRLSLTF